MAEKTDGKPSVVLVHGAWADGTSWGKVIPLLEDAGYEVMAVQLPLTSLSDDIKVAKRALALQKGPTVLVGHSYGGAVITGAGNDPHVKALVYIAAFGLDEGESLEQLSQQGPPPPGSKAYRMDAEKFFWLDKGLFAESFAQDVEPGLAKVMAAVQNPLSFASFAEKSGPPAWKKVPSWYLVSKNDRMIPPGAEEFMGKRMGATVEFVDASHVSMVSQPAVVAKMILAAAEKVAAESLELTAK